MLRSAAALLRLASSSSDCADAVKSGRDQRRSRQGKHDSVGFSVVCGQSLWRLSALLACLSLTQVTKVEIFQKY